MATNIRVGQWEDTYVRWGLVVDLQWRLANGGIGMLYPNWSHYR